jgi:hypothetical protein
MIDEPIRWSHAYGKPVVPSSWQMTPRIFEVHWRTNYAETQPSPSRYPEAVVL